MSRPKPCSIRGVDYPSRSAAVAVLGLTRQRIHQLAAQPLNGCKVRVGSKPVVIDGVTYASVAGAAAALGVSYWVARYLAKLGTVSRRSRRAPASLQARAIAKPERPPLRNAIKIIRRVVAMLESSVWIRRLPQSHRRAIAEALTVLQQQAATLVAQESHELPGESETAGADAGSPLENA
jgi:hypothetical protein